MKRTLALVPAIAALSMVGCGVNVAELLPQTPPTKVEKLTEAGKMSNIGGVAASPDGDAFYALAFDERQRPGVFRTDVATGNTEALHTGAPLLYPSDIAVSCDGGTLYVSDMGGLAADPDPIADEAPDSIAGGIHRLDSATGAITALPADGITRAAGLIVSTDCDTLYVTGWTEMGEPALFTLDLEGGGAPQVVHSGAPLVSPTGVHVDANSIAWVMDHEAIGPSGEGMLFAIDPEGNVSEVVSGLGMGRHGGVSLVPGGVTAVIPVRNDTSGETQLITANTETLEAELIPTPDIEFPTGVAAARNAPVMVVAGENGLHIATFDE